MCRKYFCGTGFSTRNLEILSHGFLHKMSSHHTDKNFLCDIFHKILLLCTNVFAIPKRTILQQNFGFVYIYREINFLKLNFLKNYVTYVTHVNASLKM